MVEKMNGLSLDFIIHPGETIKEVLEERQMNQEELAKREYFKSYANNLFDLSKYNFLNINFYLFK